MFGPVIWRGPRERRALALTFDDGPAAGTAEILTLLSRFHAQATFFLCGEHVRRTPSLAAEICAAGHEAGNHTDTHPRLWLRTSSFLRVELGRAQESIAQATGRTPGLFRPTYGVRWFGLDAVQREMGLLTVMWSTIGLDWKLSGPEVARRIVRGACNGAILCLHDGRGRNCEADASSTVDALREALPRLRDDGWEFRTVSDLIGYSNPVCPKMSSSG